MAATDSPRFQSDGEDANTKEEKRDAKMVFDSLDAASKWDAKGVDVDKRMLEGRKANRGFTMSVGSTHQDVDINALRNQKRAQTLPVMGNRRGDSSLSAAATTKLKAAQEGLVARQRRGSSAFSNAPIPDDELLKHLAEISDCHVHGIMSEGQSHGDERKWFWSTDGKEHDREDSSMKFPCANPPIVSCQKGSKGFRDTTPNQDNFSLTFFKKNGFTLACAFDGHGAFGHIVSTRTVQTVPYFLSKFEDWENNVEAALIQAFEMAQRDLVCHSLANNWDVQASGSTAVAAMWKGNKVWTANAGDSRCVIGGETDKSVIFETEDHKPITPAEKARIESMGGEVRSQTYSDGWVNHRIYVKGEDYPGLCMARTLGDESVKAHGVIATPEVKVTEVNLALKPFFILSSDGVWEFLESQFVVKAVAKKIQSDGVEKTLKKLQREAAKRWKQEEGDYCDDITSILVQIR